MKIDPEIDTGGWLGFDKRWSYALYLGNSKYKDIAMPMCKALEISAHGIPALVGGLYAIGAYPTMSIFWVNLYAGLILDLIVIATLKMIFRRPRPVYNKDDMFATVSVDKHSFPSGHSTRAFYVAALCSAMIPDENIQRGMIAWACCVGLSRVVLGRHHVLDVVAGAVVGGLQYKAQAAYLWLDLAQCAAVHTSVANGVSQLIGQLS
eukprot:m.220029 g.220029  ORF g.220029 m.220029 type:complete len:207 (+) comp33308_c3_seq12:96-716(+)